MSVSESTYYYNNAFAGQRKSDTKERSSQKKDEQENTKTVKANILFLCFFISPLLS